MSLLSSRPSILSIRRRLGAAVNGRLITPGDPAYDHARAVYGGFDRRPAAIVQAADATDVSHVVLLARERALQLAVRSGGHSLAGHSISEGGIVLDLRRMRRLDIDADHRTSWGETGLTTGAYTAAVGAHGLATGFGDTGSVGIGGLTLGGGIGYLVRKHGLTIDSLLAADVVTADGQLLHTDAETNPELFWAIRGGGGNFGVATRFQFRLHRLDQIVGGMLLLPATPEVIAGLVATAEAAPEELSAIANIMKAPPLPMVPVLGGAMARVPPHATAFAHRGRRIMAAIGAVWERLEEAAVHEAWVTGFAAALRQGDPGVYANFVGDEGENRVREAYPGSTWERLAAVKRRYDPTNLFRGNQNIPPQGRDADDGGGRRRHARADVSPKFP